MVDSFKFIAEILNIFHDTIMHLMNRFGWNSTDKDLHFWIIGIIGILCFLGVHLVFKKLAKWSITSISFIYTFTLMVVFVFAIEIQQGITKRGNVEFADAVVGLYGFLIFFGTYVVIRLLQMMIVHLIKKNRKTKNQINKESRFQG